MRRELLLLLEMIEAAARIREVIGDLDTDGLGADMLRRDAVLWNYTVLGETSSPSWRRPPKENGEVGTGQGEAHRTDRQQRPFAAMRRACE